MNLDFIKLAKETLKMQLIIFIPTTFLLILSYSKWWQTILDISISSDFKRNTFVAFIFLLSFVLVGFLSKSRQFKALYSDFHSNKMDSDIETVNNWFRNNDVKDYSIQYKLSKIDPEHNARKAISKQYNDIYKHYKKHTFKKEVKEIVPFGRAMFLIDKIEPIEKEIIKISDVEYVPSMFNFYRKLYKIK